MRMVLTIMNRTVSPTSAMATRPTLRTTLMTPTSLSSSSCLVVIWTTSCRSRSAAATDSPMLGSVSWISMLA